MSNPATQKATPKHNKIAQRGIAPKTATLPAIGASPRQNPSTIWAVCENLLKIEYPPKKSKIGNDK